METASNRRIVENTFFLYFSMLLTMAVTLYTSRLILEALGVDDFGLYDVVGGIVSFFTIINGSLIAGSSRFITFEFGRGNKESLRKTFNASFAIHCLIALIVVILAETVGLWWVNTGVVLPPERLAAANWVYQFSIISTVFGLTQVPYSALIIAHERMKIYAWLKMLGALFNLLLAFFLLYSDSIDKLIFYGMLLCLWKVSNQLYYRYYCTRNFPESKLMLVKEKACYTQMVSFSMWDMIGYFCVTGNSQGVNLLINYFFGLAINAARGVAYQAESAIVQFFHSFMTAVKPQIVKLYAVGQVEKMLTLVFESSKYAFYLLYIIALPVFLDVDYVLSIWLKEVPEFSALFLRCIIVISMIRAFAAPIVQAIHATGNIKWVNLYSGGVSILLTIPLTYLFYKLGYPAVVTFYVIGTICVMCNFLELVALKREIPFSIMNYIIRVYGTSFLIVLLSVIPMYYLYHSFETSFFRLVLVSISNLLLVSLLVFSIGISRPNRRIIIKFVKDKIICYVRR